METKNYFRWAAEWMFINEILNAEKVEISNNVSCFKTNKDLYFKRVQVIGTVIDRKVNDAKQDKKEWGFIELDDGTGKIMVNAFEQPHIDIIREITPDTSSIYLVVGLVYSRVYKDAETKHIVPEVIRKVTLDDRKYFILSVIHNRVAGHSTLSWLPSGIESLLNSYKIKIVQNKPDEVKLEVMTPKPGTTPAIEKKNSSEDIKKLILEELSLGVSKTYSNFLDVITSKGIRQKDFDLVLTELLNNGTVIEQSDTYRLAASKLKTKEKK